ncbi:MAG TPA: LysR family transcriptional regulator, partial [Bdellovibrionota bacterium]|nr:LysR family transcriptional regulator [Bdellovibrionota bacterium]
MNLDQLLVFKTIADKGTLRAAAETLGRTQPAISAALKQLESHLSFELFSRETYRPTLTARGQRMLESTRAVLESAQYWQEVADDLRGGCEPELIISIDSATPLELVIPKI